MSDSGEYHPNETSQECNWILDLRLKFSGIGCPSAAEHSRTSSLTPDNKANKNEMEGERLAYSAVNPRETAGKHEAGMGRNTTCHGGKYNEECKVDGPIRSNVWAYWYFGGPLGKPDIKSRASFYFAWRHGYY